MHLRSVFAVLIKKNRQQLLYIRMNIIILYFKTLNISYMLGFRLLFGRYWLIDEVVSIKMYVHELDYFFTFINH